MAKDETNVGQQQSIPADADPSFLDAKLYSGHDVDSFAQGLQGAASAEAARVEIEESRSGNSLSPDGNSFSDSETDILDALETADLAEPTNSVTAEPLSQNENTLFSDGTSQSANGGDAGSSASIISAATTGADEDIDFFDTSTFSQALENGLVSENEGGDLSPEESNDEVTAENEAPDDTLEVDPADFVAAESIDPNISEIDFAIENGISEDQPIEQQTQTTVGENTEPSSDDLVSSESVEAGKEPVGASIELAADDHEVEIDASVSIEAIENAQIPDIGSEIISQSGLFPGRLADEVSRPVSDINETLDKPSFDIHSDNENIAELLPASPEFVDPGIALGSAIENGSEGDEPLQAETLVTLDSSSAESVASVDVAVHSPPTLVENSSLAEDVFVAADVQTSLPESVENEIAPSSEIEAKEPSIDPIETSFANAGDALETDLSESPLPLPNEVEASPNSGEDLAVEISDQSTADENQNNEFLTDEPNLSETSPDTDEVQPGANFQSQVDSPLLDIQQSLPDTEASASDTDVAIETPIAGVEVTLDTIEEVTGDIDVEIEADLPSQGSDAQSDIQEPPVEQAAAVEDIDIAIETPIAGLDVTLDAIEEVVGDIDVEADLSSHDTNAVPDNQDLPMEEPATEEDSDVAIETPIIEAEVALDMIDEVQASSEEVDEPEAISQVEELDGEIFEIGSETDAGSEEVQLTSDTQDHIDEASEGAGEILSADGIGGGETDAIDDISIEDINTIVEQLDSDLSDQTESLSQPAEDETAPNLVEVDEALTFAIDQQTPSEDASYDALPEPAADLSVGLEAVGDVSFPDPVSGLF